MKTRLMLLVILLTGLSILAACAPPGPTASPTETPAAVATQTPATSDSATPPPATAGKLPPATAGHILYMGPVNQALQVWVMNANGTGRRPITQEPGENAFATFSRDGQQVAFTSSRDSNLELYVANVDGSEVTRITDNPAQDNLAVWSPDGKQLAFSSNRDGDTPDIYILSRSDGKVTRLTTDPGADLMGSWSPDGKKISFASDRDGDQEIYTISPEGGPPEKITDNKASDGAPAWSPDGKQIAFHSDRDGRPQIYLMDADGSHVERLTNNAADNLFPIWSPDGKQIAYTAQQQNSLEIHVVDIATKADVTIPNVVGLATGWIASNEVLEEVPLPTAIPAPPTPTSPPMEGNEVDPEILAKAPSEGNVDAPVSIVEFSDYQCPFCKRFVDETLPELRKTYIDTGKVRLLFVDYPLPIHPQAPAAAQAAHCAGDQDAYWKMHDKIFADAARWTNSDDAKPILITMAGEIGLDQDALKSCLDEATHAPEIRNGMAEGQRLAVGGTPTFFINGHRLVGAQPFSAFRDLIEAELSKGNQ
ncbi:MAG: thioredoxin domain-containing protein [Chloroflexi bacterium]|nr:thioredoxin domain-containing protein [Chloroflexota bacterium]